jgi:DNA (cytosine-5)-methyltransferase 1
MSLKIGSLFSGIGGLELGLERAGLGHTIWQVEINLFCRQVLKKHWPEAERYEDVKEVGKHNLSPVEIICGGFPCQDISVAGKGAGLTGERSGFWYEMLRVIDELKPSWIVIENVYRGWRRWLPTVRGDLWRIGYSSVPFRVRACEVGLPHERSRIFTIAHTDCKRLEKQWWFGAAQAQYQTVECNFQWKTESPVVRGIHGVSNRVDRVKALGNSVVPQCAEVIGRILQLIKKDLNHVSQND